MADLTRGDDRGQIILLAAVALAVTFATLALVVNSAIFTENLASRDRTGGGDTALVARYTAEQNAADVVAGANRYNYSSTGTLETAVEQGLRNASVHAEKHAVQSGALTNVSNPHDYDHGTRVALNASGGTTFTTGGGAKDWRLVNETDGVRAFELEVRKSGLGDDTILLDERFQVRLNDTSTGDKYRVYLWKDDADADRIHVRTEGPGGNEECTVTVPDERFRVSLTEGTVDSRACEALAYSEDGTDHRFAAGLGTYNVTIRDGDEVSGNFSLVTEQEPGELGPAVTVGSPTTGSPYGTRAVYEVDVTFEYVGPSLNYTTDVRVARGEADG